MNKQFTLIAAAALSCAGAAQAQSGLTVYGALDGGVLKMSTTASSYIPTATDAGSATTFKDGGIGGSNLGLKGERDMGNGNKAYFQLQGNLKLNDGATGGANAAGTTTNFNQMALIGLSGKAGDVKLGRQIAPTYYAMISTDARSGRYFGSTLTTLVSMNSVTKAWPGAGNAVYGNVYNDNSVSYTSPKFGDVKVGMQHVFGNVNGNNNGGSQDSVNAQYANSSGLRLSALYYTGRGNQSVNLGNNGVAAKNNQLTSYGALYTTGPWTMSFSTFDGKIPSGALVAGGSNHTTANALALAYKLDAEMTLSGGYYTITDKTNSGNKASQTAISLDYLMFKDTTAYAQYASTSNTGANMNMSPVFGNPTPAGKSNTATMVGLRYTF